MDFTYNTIQNKTVEFPYEGEKKKAKKKSSLFTFARESPLLPALYVCMSAVICEILSELCHIMPVSETN